MQSLRNGETEKREEEGRSNLLVAKIGRNNVLAAISSCNV